MLITFGMLGAFFALIVVVLYATYRKSDSSFTDYAVGGRSFSAIYIAMSYTNSWWPGTTFIAFFGLTAASGAIGLYALLYTLLGVSAMYFMASRAWRWGKRFDLRTQPDMLGLRFGSSRVKVLASVIGVVTLFPWIVLGMQAMGTIFRWASLGNLSITAALVIGVSIIAIRQIWTVQMGMRGLVITDLVQGIVAYVGAAIVCIGLLLFFFDGFGEIGRLPEANVALPGFSSDVGGLYFFGLIVTGAVGSLCWPTSYQRIYTASSVREVKRGTVMTMPIAGGFFALLSLVALAATQVPEIASDPQAGWFTLTQQAGGTWLLAVGVVVVFAASMGWIDGCIQVVGTQIANDIVAQYRPLGDRQRIIVAKASMVVVLLLASVAAYLTFDYAHLVSLAQVAYQGIIQIAVPMFCGLFWRRGNATGALAGLTVGFAVAVGLTIPYAEAGGAIPWLDGFPSGLVALAANLAVYVACAYLVPTSDAERRRIDGLFDGDGEPAPASTPVATTVPIPAAGA